MNKLTLLQILISLLLGGAILSCSTGSNPKAKQKSYSNNTQKEFEAIEKYNLHSKPLSGLKATATSIPLSSVEQETVDVSQLNAKNQERLQEINQNLAFYCMKHRKDFAFKDEKHCLAYTSQILASCEKKHKLINTIMLNCIKERLKK